jgi:adenylate cyclase
MGTEIERKYLVDVEAWTKARPRAARSEDLAQGYLATDPRRMVRVRKGATGAWLTIKGEADGARRPEWEYAIPAADADELLALCGGAAVHKTRHSIEHEGFTWVVDELHEANEGLVLAEIEVPTGADLERAVQRLPAWAARDVTDDPRYTNLQLALRPWSTWSVEERDELRES